VSFRFSYNLFNTDASSEIETYGIGHLTWFVLLTWQRSWSKQDYYFGTVKSYLLRLH